MHFSISFIFDMSVTVNNSFHYTHSDSHLLLSDNSTKLFAQGAASSVTEEQIYSIIGTVSYAFSF
jgi:hypothetical protein